jgi:hypothetical protein
LFFLKVDHRVAGVFTEVAVRIESRAITVQRILDNPYIFTLGPD